MQECEIDADENQLCLCFRQNIPGSLINIPGHSQYSDTWHLLILCNGVKFNTRPPLTYYKEYKLQLLGFTYYYVIPTCTLSE